jgi:hypothetical protein
LDTVQCEDVSFANESNSSPPSTPTVVLSESQCVTGNTLQTLLKDIHNKWVWGDDITGNLERLMDHLANLVMSCVMPNPSSPEENIFILISRTIPLNDQVSLTSAILSKIDEICDLLPAGGGVDWDHWDTWTIVHTSSTLKSLKEAISLPYPITLYADDRIGTNVIKLIMDASVRFVGEQILSKLKSLIKRRHGKCFIYDIYLQDYKAVLDALYRRKINVRQDLFAFLGRLLVWEGNDEQTDDENERALFETSDEESNVSENESVESEIESGDEEGAANVWVPQL